jgi:energy-coupling factor transporter ATP-binding protein EcfA2
MIKNIKVSNNDKSIEIRLENPLSKLIYQVDSLNLLIGENGSGKTTIIKKIIKSMISNKNTKEVTIFPSQHSHLGIIYYTASPFHKKISHRKTYTNRFSDASPTAKGKSSLQSTITSHQKIAKIFNVENKLISVKEFNFPEIIFNWLRIYYSSAISTKHKFNFPMLTDSENEKLIESIKSYNIAYNSHKNTQEALQRLEKKQNNAKQINDKIDYTSIKKRFDALQLKSEKALIAANAEAENAQSIIATAFFKKSDKKLYENFVEKCIAIECTKSPYRANGKLEFLFGSVDDTPSAFKENLLTVRHFFQLLKKYKLGKTFFSEEHIFKIKLDISAISRSKFENEWNAFEEAHNLELFEINFGKISSGEAAILHQTIYIYDEISKLSDRDCNKFVIFIDEGDMLLHLSWQREYLNAIDTLLGKVKEENNIECIQLIVATHSPLLTTDILRDSITCLDRTGTIPAFGAPIQRVFNEGFSTKSVGAIAERVILKLSKQQGEFSNNDKKIIENIDDAFIRHHLRKA